ncbi:anthranilate synthase component I family protein [bacterium]|nr:anthranilate synthase component I family protein [bacterium]
MRTVRPREIDTGIGDSPRTIFERIAASPGAFWIDGGELGISFLGALPDARFAVAGDGSVSENSRTTRTGDPLDAIAGFVARATADTGPGSAPRVVGALAYDLAPFVEPRMSLATARPHDDLPVAALCRYPAVAACRREGPGGAWSTRIEADDAASARRLERLLATGSRAARPAPAGDPVVLEAPDGASYRRAIEAARALIADGDVYLVNLAQRYVLDGIGDPAGVFLSLREAQPVPLGAFFDAGSAVLFSNSPERFLRVGGGRIVTEPIKGTRPRGATPREDEALRRELAGDEKERAEHVMTVDLERNDLGRVCVAGSVHVPSLLRVETFATLHHLVSTVEGELLAGVGLAEVLRATFPGGSVTGAPKIRAAQVIAALEPERRGFYTGALAWFRGPLDFDSSIAIRTATVRGGRLVYPVGAGIVADSDANLEHRECRLKAAALLRAAGLDADAEGRPTPRGSRGGEAIPPSPARMAR